MFRYHPGGSGVRLSTIEATTKLGPNVAPPSTDLRPRTWLVPKSSHATYSSPSGPIALQAPLLIGLASASGALHVVPPSVERVMNTVSAISSKTLETSVYVRYKLSRC